jgi:hypothetical protein
MTFQEIREQVMFQTNNDADDLEDYLPHVSDYVNEGYDRLVKAWAQKHVPVAEFPPLKYDDDIPAIPNWTHRALVDYATWLVYRNGNPQKQQRGLYFLRAFEDVLARIADEGGIDGLDDDGNRKVFKKFVNIPV